MRGILKVYYSIIILISFFTSIYVFQNNIHYGYEYAFVLPFIYAVFALIITWSNTKKLVINLIYLVYFIRFVVLPFMTIYSGWYTGRAFNPPLEDSYELAILLMCAEFLLINSFYFLFLRKVDFSLYRSHLNLKLNKSTRDYVYVIFIIFSISLIPLISNQVSFLGMGVGERSSGMSQFQTLIFFSLYVSKYLLIGLLIKYFYIKHIRTKSNIYIFLTVVSVLMINSIFIGYNRMDFVLPFLASFLMLNYLYKKKMLLYNIFSVGLLVTSLYLISLVRNTFDYQIVNDTPSLITDYLQVYFAGIYNVALSLEIGSFYNQNGILTFIYDLIRPFLGLNLLWRSESLNTTAELFNQRIFGNDHISQIVPLLGQFYHAFGILGVLVSTALFTIIVYLSLKNIRNTFLVTSLISLVLLIRVIVSPIQNLSIYLNEFSSIIIIFVSLNITSYILKVIFKR